MHSVPGIKKNGAGSNLEAAAQTCNTIKSEWHSAARVLAPDVAMLKRTYRNDKIKELELRASRCGFVATLLKSAQEVKAKPS